jgi:hypothetical protein
MKDSTIEINGVEEILEEIADSSSEELDNRQRTWVNDDYGIRAVKGHLDVMVTEENVEPGTSGLSKKQIADVINGQIVATE